jgi:uncharacterized protein (DUF924 family)
MHDRIRFIAQLLFVVTALIAGFLGAYALGKEQPVERPAAVEPAVDASPAAASTPTTVTDPEALRVVAFWIDAGPALWFAKNEEFDARFRDRFLKDHELAASGDLRHWQNTAEGALALVLLLDQFPRNAFRGTPRMYRTDALARRAARQAFAAGYDREIPMELRKFFVLPLAHSEDVGDQERSVKLARRMNPEDLVHAEHHRDIVRRFGRFPHRNQILGRQSTKAELEYLANGGFTG